MSSLLIMRHAHAVSAAELRCNDEERPLSVAGSNAVRAMRSLLKRAQVQNPLVLTSPLRRAQETALQLAAAWEGVHVQTVDSLAPGGGDDFSYYVEAEACSATAIAVGHIPDVLHIAEAFIGSRLSAGVFEPATVVWIEFSGAIQRGRGIIRDIVSAELASRLAL